MIRRGKAYSGERGGWSVILEKTSLTPGAEHRLPVFSSCVQLSAVEPTVKDFSS